MLYYKSLAEEKFHWPGGEEELVSLTGQQINWLLDGYDLRAMKGHKKLVSAPESTPFFRTPSATDFLLSHHNAGECHGPDRQY